MKDLILNIEALLIGSIASLIIILPVAVAYTMITG